MAMEGRLATGTRLPSERALAEVLGLSRTTVTRAYGELVATGWARARQGSGTTIRLPAGARIPSLPLVPGQPTDAIDLSAAAGLAPARTEALIRRAMDWLPATLNSAGYEPFGAPHLRDRIAAWYVNRGLPTTPDQIIVTPGAMAAVSVAFHLLLSPGARVVVDSPTYPGALGVLAAVRGRPVPVALHSAWDLDAWAAALRRSGARCAYLIPDFHNPTGLVLPDRQRAVVSALFRDQGCTAVVDETLVELDFDTAGQQPFAGFDPGAITVGSLSKTLWGGIRIGWLRCPSRLVESVRAKAVQLSLGASALDQLIATTYLEQPQSLRDEVVGSLRSARDRWLTELTLRLPDWRAEPPAGGLALWVELPRRSAAELATAAAAHGLVVAPGPVFSVDRTHQNRIRLPLTLPSAVIPEAVARLAAAWADVIAGPTTGALPNRLAL